MVLVLGLELFNVVLPFHQNNNNRCYVQLAKTKVVLTTKNVLIRRRKLKSGLLLLPLSLALVFSYPHTTTKTETERGKAKKKKKKGKGLQFELLQSLHSISCFTPKTIA